MDELALKAMSYQEVLNLARKTEWNLNHAGWIIYEDNRVKFTLDTLNNGLSFRIGQWEPCKNVGKIIHEIFATEEFKFLIALNTIPDNEDESDE
jgi:hypothetical protein